MQETINKMLKHPIRSAIIINATLAGVACTIKMTCTGVAIITKEVRALCELYKKGDKKDGK